MQQTTQGDALNMMECKLKMNHFIERKWRFFWMWYWNEV